MQGQGLSMREIQMGAYEVLKAVSKICEGQGLRYALTYGSLIGAVREGGIIPWDDDIDIMMPRPDYERLLIYFDEHSEDLYPLRVFERSAIPGYPHMIARISDQRYRLVFDNEKDYGIGIFVDIYPFDGVGKDRDTAIRLIHKTKRLAALCFLTSRRSFAVDNTGSKLKMLFKLPAYLWAKLMGNEHYTSRLEEMARRYRYEESTLVACVVWPAGRKYGRERDVFSKGLFDVIYVRFEDSMMPIPKDYDEFLTITYGDYMAPPSEDEKKTHHTYHAYKV